MPNEIKAVRIRKEINEARAKHEKLSNEQLVIHIQAGIDTTENMVQLWQQNQGIIGKLAGKRIYGRKYTKSINRELQKKNIKIEKLLKVLNVSIDRFKQSVMC